MIGAADLGIREVDTAEALAAAGLTHGRYAPGESVPWDPGVFLLDVATGAVEGWVRSLARLAEDEREEAWRAREGISVFPSDRFVSWASFLHDRHTGRTHTWGDNGLQLEGWWGYGRGERLLFGGAGTGAVIIDGDLEAVAELSIPLGERFTAPTGNYILVRECVGCEPGDRFHLVNLQNESSVEVHTWVLPWKTVRHLKTGEIPYRIDLLQKLVAFVAEVGPNTCRVARYGLDGSLLSDRTISCLSREYFGLPRISPDGKMIFATTSMALIDDTIVSIFDATTGMEILRVKSLEPISVTRLWVGDEALGTWLADSSGVMVGTHAGPRIVTIDGAWTQAPGWPSSHDPDLFFALDPPRAMNEAGDVLSALSFGDTSAPVPDPGYLAILVLEASVDWSAIGDALRVRTTFFHTQEGLHLHPPLPLAPVIERPPFEDRLLVEVVADPCLNLRERPSLNAPILACLPEGAVAGTDDFVISPQPWMRLRTDDGLIGWASVDYLRWHPGGVPLED